MSTGGVFSKSTELAFSGITFEQLHELVKSSILLEDIDRKEFVQKYNSQTPSDTINILFTAIFWQEYYFLENEIAENTKELQQEQNQVIAPELKAEIASYQQRLDALKLILQNYKASH